MMEEISVEDPRDSSLEDPVCIDDVVFYGPITAKEKLIRERFEKMQKEKYKPQLMSAFSNGGIAKDCFENKVDTLEESKNEGSNDLSIYESFSIEESKYESFDDSLDDRKNVIPSEINVSQFLSDQVNVNVRKTRVKQKLRGSLCDSLEDVHSLISNAEKLSVSEEIENINILEKSHIFDDSLRNDICVENKNTNSNEQNFDDDSLAILEFEKAFDDSLEETDLPLSHMDSLLIVRNSSGDTEISVENLANENASYVTRNLFENSVEIIYENTRSVATSEEENCGIIKQLSLTGDSLSISENMSRDSLDDFQRIPKSLEPNEEPKNIVYNDSDNVNPSDSENFHKLESGNRIEYFNDIKTDSILAIPPNLSTIVGELLPTCIKRNSSYSNDTIFIEDSFILSSEVDKKRSTEDKLLGHENVMESISPKVKETICADDFVLISTSNNSSVLHDNFRISKKNIDEIGICSNDTIYINDSFVSPCSPTKEIHIIASKFPDQNVDCNYPPNKNNEFRNLKENDSETTSPKLNNTIYIDDSFILPDKCPLIVKQERNPSTDIKAKNKNIGFKKRIPSPVKYGKSQTPEQKNNEMGSANFYDTVFIEDSFISPSKPILNIKKESSFTAVNAKNKQSIELQKKKEKMNHTNKKRSPSLQNSYSASHCSNKAQDTIAYTLNSPVNEFKEYDTVGFIELKSPNKTESSVNDVLTTKCLPNEGDLNLQLGVTFGKIQDTNTIPISTVEQCTVSKNFSHDEANTIKVNVAFANLSHNVNDQKKGITAFDYTKNTNTVEKIMDGNSSDALKPTFYFVDTDSQQKDASPCSNYPDDTEIKLHTYDVQLLQALDLHDTSYNPSNGCFQSRDSLIPLNLCMRDKSQEKVCNCIINTESKENIPFYPSSKLFGRGDGITNNSKNKKDFPQKAVNKTPKQLIFNADVKKSGTKASSATKIPVRKVDMFPTPVHQKTKKDYQPVSAGDKCTKSPLVKSLSATDAVSCTKSASATDMITPRKHHFCMVRNSISRVPKSAQRSIPKKFQNIESPVAKYIGRVQLCTPLKTAHWCDGNIIGNTLKANKPTKKTPSNICRGSPKFPCSGKL